MLYFLSLVLFGVLQGLTEFLPVSSSGHLAMFSYFSASIQEDLSLNIAVHVGTLLTILIYYRRDILELVGGVVIGNKNSIQMVGLILVASIPTGIIGILMKKNLNWVLTHPLVAANCLLVSALILWLSDRARTAQNPAEGFGITYWKAFLIGTVQGFAVLPGISRSGSTIVAGLFLGMSPQNGARFSFLISVPAIAGAGLLELMSAEEAMDFQSLSLGALISFVTGLIAIHWMVKVTLQRRLRAFAYYLVPVALLFIALYSFGIGEGAL